VKIHIKYISVFLILLITEILIALFVHDAFIRPYFGDVLVVILMYTFIRGITKKPIKLLPIYLFLFASSVELAQYYHVANILHLQNNRLISTIIGASFDTKDILCYLVAAVILIVWQRIEEIKFLKNLK